jgi:hypothetical protein
MENCSMNTIDAESLMYKKKISECGDVGTFKQLACEIVCDAYSFLLALLDKYEMLWTHRYPSLYNAS